MQFQELAGPWPTPCSQAVQLPRSAPSGAVCVCVLSAARQLWWLVSHCGLPQLACRRVVAGQRVFCVMGSCSSAAVRVTVCAPPDLLFLQTFLLCRANHVSRSSAGDTLLLACGFLFANLSDPWPGSSQVNREVVHAVAHSSPHVAVACLRSGGPVSRWDMPRIHHGCAAQPSWW
jgi:hypothetical protein